MTENALQPHQLQAWQPRRVWIGCRRYSHWVKQTGVAAEPNGQACAFADVVTYHYFKGTGFSDR